MILKNLKFYLQYFLLGSEEKLYGITKTFSRHKSLFVSKQTDIVIEGYPRCGNTFAVAAFKYAQEKSGKKVKIARHRHEIAQILLAAEYKIPTLVLIREPLEAISSFIVRENIKPQLAIKYYIRYYKCISAIKADIVIADFREVTTNYGGVINQINKKYDKDFAIFKHTPRALEEVKKIIEKMELEDSGGGKVRITHLAFPTDERKVLKQRVKDIILNNDQLLRLLNEARKVYREITGSKYRSV